MIAFILLPTEVDLIFKEKRSKKNSVKAFSSSGGKIILTLLIEVIVFHVRFIAIYV